MSNCTKYKIDYLWLRIRLFLNQTHKVNIYRLNFYDNCIIIIESLVQKKPKTVMARCKKKAIPK